MTLLDEFPTLKGEQIILSEKLHMDYSKYSSPIHYIISIDLLVQILGMKTHALFSNHHKEGAHLMDLSQTLLESLGIEVVSLDKQLVILTMPVDHRTRQPAGFLHGGASVALAETAASIGSILHVDPDDFNVFGIEINANHVKSKRDGHVTAKAKPLHVGRTTMVWEINIMDEHHDLICISRCTVGIVPKKK